MRAGTVVRCLIDGTEWAIEGTREDGKYVLRNRACEAATEKIHAEHWRVVAPDVLDHDGLWQVVQRPELDLSKVRPLGRNVFARVLATEEKVRVDSLIYIPGTARGRPSRAVVERAGPDSVVVPGDVIGFDPYRIKVVIGHGQLANARGTPVANTGELFVIDDLDVFYVDTGAGVEEEDEEQDRRPYCPPSIEQTEEL